MADAEIARFHDILRQIDELQNEFAKIKRIGEIVKGFRARVEALDRRVWCLRHHVSYNSKTSKPGLIVSNWTRKEEQSYHTSLPPTYNTLHSPWSRTTIDDFTLEVLTNRTEKIHITRCGPTAKREHRLLRHYGGLKRRIASRLKIYPLQFVGTAFSYFLFCPLEFHYSLGEVWARDLIFDLCVSQ